MISLRPLILAALLAHAATAQAQIVPRLNPLQQARVNVAQETAQVRLLERSGQLQPGIVTVSCLDRQGNKTLAIWKDKKGATRIVRLNQNTPERTMKFTAYFDPTGRMRYGTGVSYSNGALLFNVTSEYGPDGKLLYESGSRAPTWTADLKQLVGLNVAALAKGQCLR